MNIILLDLFAFLEFQNLADTRPWSCFVVKMFKISFDFIGKVLIRAKYMNTIFISFYSII
jgi:hypothetical protein